MKSFFLREYTAAGEFHSIKKGLHKLQTLSLCQGSQREPLRRIALCDLAVLRYHYIHAGSADILDDDIADPEGCLGANFVDLFHAPEDLVLRNVGIRLDAGPLLGAAHYHNCGGNCALRMCDFLAGILVADRAGVALYAEDFPALKLYRDLAAHGAADTSKISLFHILTLL